MTITIDPNGISLDDETSGRLRQLLRNTCDINGVAVRELKLAGVFGDGSSRATVARMVSGANDCRIHSRFLPHCIAWLAEVIGCSSTDLNDYILDGKTKNAAIQEMTARRVFTHTAPQLASYANEVKTIKAVASECWLIADVPSASLLPEPVMQRVFRWKTETMQQPFHDFRIELDFGRRRWGQFQESAGHGLSACGVILTLSGMDQLLRPNGACSLPPHEKDIFVETLLDRMEVYNVQIGLLNDRSEKVANTIRPFLDRFDMLAVFNQGTSIRRLRNQSERLLYVAADSVSQAAIVKADIDRIEFARGRATLDPDTVREWLLEHASDDSWRKIRRRMDSKF